MRPQYKFLFALLQIASAFLCLRMIFPTVLNVSWQGSTTEEVIFILLLWFISSLIIGLSIMASVLYAIVLSGKSLVKEDGQTVDRAGLAGSILSSSLPRWMMSLSPCFGPALALAILAYFYRYKLMLDNPLAVAKASAIVGLVTFIICLPLTLQMQKTLAERAREKFPGVEIEDPDTSDQ